MSCINSLLAPFFSLSANGGYLRHMTAGISRLINQKFLILLEYLRVVLSKGFLCEKKSPNDKFGTTYIKVLDTNIPACRQDWDGRSNRNILYEIVIEIAFLSRFTYLIQKITLFFFCLVFFFFPHHHSNSDNDNNNNRNHNHNQRRHLHH